MTTQASTQNASGPLTLHLVKPARARYVIIWFTKLPPFAVGQYRDEIVFTDDGARFRSKLVLLDTNVLPRYFIYPL